MTLEEDLLKKGFKARGPVEMSRMSEVITQIINSLETEESPIPYLHMHIIQGKLAREDMEYPGLYMIYYSTEKP